MPVRRDIFPSELNKFDAVIWRFRRYLVDAFGQEAYPDISDHDLDNLGVIKLRELVRGLDRRNLIDLFYMDDCLDDDNTDLDGRNKRPRNEQEGGAEEGKKS